MRVNFLHQSLFSFLFLVLVASSAAASEPSNASIAVGASIKLCLFPLADGKSPDDAAKQNGARQLPDELYQNFKKRPIDKAGYVIKPGEIIFLTTTKNLCSIAIRTLETEDFSTRIKSYFSEANQFTKTVDKKREDGSHSFEFKTVLNNRPLLVIASYSDQPREDGMQGLITIAVTSKDEN